MTVDDGENDPILAAVASLRTYDVSQRRSGRLRRRCHTLQSQPVPKGSPVMVVATAVFQRIVAPALGGAWCLAYLMELFRRVVAIYGTQ